MEVRIGDDRVYAIVSSVGGTVTRFVHEGKDIIFPQQVINGKLRGGIPICFPFFGPTPSGFSPIPQHGWLRNQELKLVHQTKNNVLFYGSCGQREGYPWFLSYEVAITVISTDALHIMLWVKGETNASAPVNPALHPYFSNLGSREFRNKKLSTKDFSEVAWGFPIESQSAFINLGEKNVEMTLGNSLVGGWFTLWSDSLDYFCVEPSLTKPDFFATPSGRHLYYGEILDYGCLLRVI